MSIHDILRQYWGYEAFRPLQEDIINSVLEGKDTLALLPTGGGKSVCFQVPAMAKDGLCIVVSPLIALMKDQAENLNKRDIPAIALYSGLSFREMDLELNNCMYGKYKFLYLSPERLETEIFRERVKQMPVNLIAVDEAHCISQWGYDFRPEYLKIASLREIVPNVPIIALTATATPDVVQDIQDKLLFRKPNVFSKSFERKNLHYLVLYEEDKWQRLLSICRKVKGTGVIYVRNRRMTKEIADFLQHNGIRADYYHAGLTNTERAKKQDDWTSGRTSVIAATNAFGMGIDKPDVRYVVHFELPENLEAYYQEAGRAGRDEQTAWCTLLYSHSDGKKALERFESGAVDSKEVERMLNLLYTFYNIAESSGAGSSYDFYINTFCLKYDLKANDVYNTAKALEQQDIISISDAVLIQPKIRFTVSNTTLYEYQMKYPVMTEFVKLILRSYGGAFEQYVPISPAELGRRMNTDKATIEKALQRLHENGVIDYQPQKDKPQLTFHYARGTAAIDRNKITTLKNTRLQKLKAAIHYAEQETECRSVVLLRYFGQDNASPCGHCDVCISMRQGLGDAATFTDYKEKIESLLKLQPTSVSQLLQYYGVKHETKLLDCVRKLSDANQIEEIDGLLYWKSAK